MSPPQVLVQSAPDVTVEADEEEDVVRDATLLSPPEPAFEAPAEEDDGCDSDVSAMLDNLQGRIDAVVEEQRRNSSSSGKGSGVSRSPSPAPPAVDNEQSTVAERRKQRRMLWTSSEHTSLSASVSAKPTSRRTSAFAQASMVRLSL